MSRSRGCRKFGQSPNQSTFAGGSSLCTLRAQQAWRETNPWHELYVDVGRRSRHTNAAKAAVARTILTAVWHMLSRNQPFKPAPRTTERTPVPASSRVALAA
jgi:hypothetical protein